MALKQGARQLLEDASRALRMLRWNRRVLAGVNAHERRVFLAVILVLSCAALPPARKAAALDPLKALQPD